MPEEYENCKIAEHKWCMVCEDGYYADLRRESEDKQTCNKALKDKHIDHCKAYHYRASWGYSCSQCESGYKPDFTHSECSLISESERQCKEGFKKEDVETCYTCNYLEDFMVIDSLMPGQRQLCQKKGILPTSSSAIEPISSSSSSTSAQDEPSEEPVKIWWYVGATVIGIVAISLVVILITTIVRSQSVAKMQTRQFTSLPNKEFTDQQEITSGLSEEHHQHLRHTQNQSNFDRELGEVSIDISVASDDRSDFL